MRVRTAAIVNLLFVATIGAMLFVPAIGLVINTAASPAALTALLPRPFTTAALAALPGLLDQLISANHGNRDEMVRADAAFRGALGGESRRVAFGTDGFLFFKGDDVFSQITGQRLDRSRLANLIELATELSERYSRNGRQFIAFVAPNKHTIYRRNLPAWARAKPAVTERDLFIQSLRSRGVTAVDPTAQLLARAATESVYWRGDTHWTQYGMIIGFDAMVDALGMPEQAIDADTVFGGWTAIDRPGDIVRFAGLGETWSEQAPKRIGPDLFSEDGLVREKLQSRQNSTSGYRLRHKEGAARSGPKVLVLGDSFTVGFGPLFMRFAGEFMFMHHQRGAYDRQLVEEFDPDIVILETVERYLNLFPATEAK